MHGDNTIGTILSLAGSDNTGGAGIQADIKTACAFRVYAATVVTAVTAQNCNGVVSVGAVGTELLKAQLDTIFEVMTPDAVKIGMLPDASSAEIIASYLREMQQPAIVVDPVLTASSGGSLTGNTDETLAEMKRSLFPLAAVLTPNLPEAMAIAGVECDDREYVCKLLKNVTGAGAVLLKGGHSDDGSSCEDLLYDGRILRRYVQYRIDSPNTHGTGCVLSTAVACGLAKGFPLHKSVRMAKDFISFAIQEGKKQKVMNGRGPLYLFG